MAPNPKVAKAFAAMKAIGISEEIVKPVLKNLLRLYDKNWELIEEENYRVLADSIFDYEECKATEEKNKKDVFEHESEPPSKRLRSRYQDEQASPSVGNSSLILGETSSRRPKLEEETCSRQDRADPLQLYVADKRAEPEPVSPQTHLRDKRKEPASPQTCPRQEAAGVSQIGLRDRSIESDLVSPQAHLRDKGKEPVSPQIAPREKRSPSERVSRVVCFKEPKIEPGIVLLPRKKVANRYNYDELIEPKSEPFTDDLPQFEVPLAMVPPLLGPLRSEGAVGIEGSSIGNDSSVEEDGLQCLASQPIGAEDEGDCDSDTACRTGTNCDLVNVPEESSANLEIASSPLGEVKISLSCTSALGRPDFHMPSLDEVLKMVEDKCLKSYRIIEPSFSVMNLMKELCQCYLDLGTQSTDDEGGKLINIPPDLDSMGKSNIQNVLGAKENIQNNFHMPAGSLNGSLNLPSSVKVVVPQIPRLLAMNGLDGLDHIRQLNRKVGISNGERCKMKKELKGRESPTSSSLVVVQQHQFNDLKPLHDVNDISKGEEIVKISLVNEFSGEQYPPTFYYIPQNLVYQSAYVNFSLARIADEDCCSSCFGDCLSSSLPCACARETGGEFAYTLEGRVKEGFLDECITMNRDPQGHPRRFYCKDCPLERSKNEDIPDPCKGHLMRKFIKECWSKCGCNKQCGNRVVQRGITCNLQVFMTPEGKGWGLRTLEDLPRGTFVCEYVGEIVTNTELYERNMRSSGREKHTYPVLLDADWGSEGVLKDEEALCLDATFYGNAARFINHRCFDANLVEIPVEVETPDHHYYHLAFFTTRKVDALEELTWDYGIDFDDHDHPVKAFQCRCGSKLCRDMKRSTRSKSSTLILR